MFVAGWYRLLVITAPISFLFLMFYAISQIFFNIDKVVTFQRNFIYIQNFHKTKKDFHYFTANNLNKFIKLNPAMNFN